MHHLERDRRGDKAHKSLEIRHKESVASLAFPGLVQEGGRQFSLRLCSILCGQTRVLGIFRKCIGTKIRWGK